ncbi:MAG: hypothetical protein WAO56_12645 [Miniphocaeibacter sp.]|uniref:hypothetical protein n=1 Tax=Miniphocaeibacter sp. TaxID=3100973 RepID=UPI00182A0046|nr:hypothetical protein [Gallicola sp.]
MIKAEYIKDRNALQEKAVRTLPNMITGLKNHIDDLKTDVEYTKLNPDDDFKMTINGVDYDDKKLVVEKLSEVISLRNIKGKTPIEVGKYRGFRLSISYSYEMYQFSAHLVNKCEYEVQLGNDMYGNLTRINNKINSIPEELERYTNNLISKE